MLGRRATARTGDDHRRGRWAVKCAGRSSARDRALLGRLASLVSRHPCATTAPGALLLLVSPALAQVIERVSLTNSGAQANDESSDASVTADGRYVAFISWATNLVAGDTNGFED